MLINPFQILSTPIYNHQLTEHQWDVGESHTNTGRTCKLYEDSMDSQNQTWVAEAVSWLQYPQQNCATQPILKVNLWLAMLINSDR